MRYIALRELTMSGGRVLPPGSEVPEAAEWDRSWFVTGHVGMFPDEMVDEIKAAIEGGYQGVVHAAQVDHANLRGALMGRGKPTSKGDGDDAVAKAAPRHLDNRNPPPGKVAITADAGVTPGELAKPHELALVEAEAVDDEAEHADPEAAPTDEPTDTRRARRRRR